MILTKAQAEAIYSAICALNDVGGTASSMFVGDARVRGHVDGRVQIWLQANPNEAEAYASQAAFAIAYGLQQG